MKLDYYYKNTRDEIRSFLPQNYQTVLEIGCGEGNFSKILKPNCEIWGVELCEKASLKASLAFYKVITGRIQDVHTELPDIYFDLVVCNDVIEHVEDHDWLLETLKSKLKNKSYLVGSVPNVRYYNNLKRLLYNRDWSYTKDGILDSTHLRFFTELSLIKTLQNHSFLIEKISGINEINFKRYGRMWLIHKIISYIAIFLSFGAYSDVKYMQFAFLAVKDEHD